jgi:hypothetical protein
MAGYPCWCGGPWDYWLSLWDQDGELVGSFPVCADHIGLDSWSVELKLRTGIEVAANGDDWWRDEFGTRVGAAEGSLLAN